MGGGGLPHDSLLHATSDFTGTGERPRPGMARWDTGVGGVPKSLGGFCNDISN